jgi:hypothetical protein
MMENNSPKLDIPERIYVYAYEDLSIIKGNSLFGVLERIEGQPQPSFLQAMAIDSDWINYGTPGEIAVFADMEIQVVSNRKAELSDEELAEAGYLNDDDFRKLLHPDYVGPNGPDENSDI